MMDNLILDGAAEANEIGFGCKIVTGISSDQDIIGEITEVNEKCEIFTHLDQEEYTKLLNECKVSISMSGYGTAVQLLYAKKTKSILIPWYENNEQGYRAFMLRDLLNSKVMKSKNLNKEVLVSEIKGVLERQEADPTIKEEWFSGLDKVEAALENVHRNNRRTDKPACKKEAVRRV